MKKTTPVIIAIALFFCAACDKTAPQNDVAIAETVHCFYKWYNAFQNDPARNNIVLAKEWNNFTLLDTVELKRLTATWKACPEVNEEFLTKQEAFWKRESSQWTSTPFGDQPSGTEQDNFICAQDADFKLYETTNIKIKNSTETTAEIVFDKKADAVMGNPTVFLSKNNGKWTVSNIVCN